MANFNEVLKFLIEGKKVRRKIWNEGHYLQMFGGQILNKNNVAPDLTHLSTLTAIDWEIYEEIPKVFEDNNFKITIAEGILIVKNKISNSKRFGFLDYYIFAVGTNSFDILKKAVKEAERTR